MEGLHYNCKEIKLDFDGEVIVFPSKTKLVEYMREAHGIGDTTIKLIIKSKQPYKPRQHALKYLTGMRIYYT